MNKRPTRRRRSKPNYRKNKQLGSGMFMHNAIDFSSSKIIGAGGYGIIVHMPGQLSATKLLYELQDFKNLQNEATIQQTCYKLFKTYLPMVKIPRVHSVQTNPIEYKGSQYLCGITMDYLQPPSGFQEQLHMLLGYPYDDIDKEWGKQISSPVSPTNPTRGFFASPETLEMIWEEEQSSMTISTLAYLMGCSYSCMISNGIIPIDLEWVWANGFPTILDFGLCRFGTVDKIQFYYQKGLSGLADDFYIPHKGDRGYEEFMKGYLSNVMKTNITID